MSETRTCKVCPNVFEITDGEIEHLNQLKADGKIEEVYLPVRCGACRRKKKLNNPNRDNRDYS